MTSKQFFVKTFFFVFVFYIVYKFVGQFMEGSEGMTVEFILRTLAIGFVVAAVLGGVNYYAKVNFFTRKNKK